MRLVLAALFAWLMLAPAGAVEPQEMLKDPALEARARALSVNFRCLVCQNQSIDDSDAPLARDLRVLIRERITAGDSDQQVIEYLVGRYGEFVLLKPRFGAHTLLLWLGPFAILLLGLFLVIRARRSAPAPVAERPLSEDEARKLNEKLKSND